MTNSMNIFSPSQMIQKINYIPCPIFGIVPIPATAYISHEISVIGVYKSEETYTQPTQHTLVGHIYVLSSTYRSSRHHGRQKSAQCIHLEHQNGWSVNIKIRFRIGNESSPGTHDIPRLRFIQWGIFVTCLIVPCLAW